MKVDDVKIVLKNTDMRDIPDTLKELEEDNRIGVQKLIVSYKKKYTKYLIEMNRLRTMNYIEKMCYQRGAKLIAGIDEVGRGPLAGPVVTAAVILPENCMIYGVNDSKKLTRKRREELAIEIEKNAIAISIASVSSEIIDEINILQATLESMEKSINKLKITPDIILVDGNKEIPHISISQKNIIAGDSKSISIAAASIVAKVFRDKMMRDFDDIYKGYNFKQNKGYGTKEHINAIAKLGSCPIHRRSFLKNIIFN